MNAALQRSFVATLTGRPLVDMWVRAVTLWDSVRRRAFMEALEWALPWKDTNAAVARAKEKMDKAMKEPLTRIPSGIPVIGGIVGQNGEPR